MRIEPTYKDDQTLIAAIKNREHSAFKYLYQNCTGQIKNFVRTNGGQEADAEEVEQNVIILMYEKIVANQFTLNEGTKLSTYMFAVGKNMWYKKINKKSDTFNIDTLIEMGEDDDFSDIINIVDENEKIVVDALMHSDQDCKKILTMYYYENKSMREISENMGSITEDNLRKRKYKCIQKLKKVVLDKINYHG